jgi:hypothetical protein
METFYSNQASEDKSRKKKIDKKTRKENKNIKQSTNECFHKNAEETIIESSNKSNNKKIQEDWAHIITDIHETREMRSTSRDLVIQEVEEQVIKDRFGDVPK